MRAFSPPARYHFFGGKGGVGKTTAASAAAFGLLGRARDGERVLIISTDPAHSLSDSLALEIGDRLVEAARRGGARLMARELDAGAALSRFKKKHSRALALIAERGTLLDESDIDELLDLSLPGMDEVMALFELSRLEAGAGYSHVVVDTAPSGHAWRMLELPDHFAGWIEALNRMEDKHRYMVAHLARGRPMDDEVEAFLRELNERLDSVRRILYDPGRSSFTFVTVPEGMIVEETSRYFGVLRRHHLPVTDIIVNRVERGRTRCEHCRARRHAQQPWLERIARDFDGLNVHLVPLLAEEVRGPRQLRRFARLAWGDAKEDADRRKTPPRARACFIRPGRAGFEIGARQLLIFGGKGGVGKTTAASAAALALAESDAGARVLVFSTDPAHSLSDSFGEAVGELKRAVAGVKNLDAMEIDAAARFEQLKNRYLSLVDESFDALTSGTRWQIQFDREAMRGLGSLTPPGIDEMAALSAVIELLEEGGYTSIVLDTAPTGHLIRFLEMPDLALSWVRAFMKLLVKYKGLARWAEIAEELIALSKNLKRMASLLSDAKRCELVGVAIAERMSLEETVRLVRNLKRLKVPMRRLLINGVVPAEAAARCGFCAARRRAQESVIKEFRERFEDKAALFLAPQQPREVRGAELLREHFANWRALGDT